MSKMSRVQSIRLEPLVSHVGFHDFEQFRRLRPSWKTDHIQYYSQTTGIRTFANVPLGIYNNFGFNVPTSNLDISATTPFSVSIDDCNISTIIGIITPNVNNNISMANVPNGENNISEPALPGTNWTAAEEDAIHQVIRKIRGVEDTTGDGHYLRDVAFWQKVSEELDHLEQEKSLQRPNERARTGTACKNYWSRRGRKLHNYDERRGKQRTTALVTSAQKKKSKKCT
jgi:hypothetical protein